VNETLVVAHRTFGDAPLEVGETVGVFLYRLFVTSGDDVYLLENESLKENYVYI
jgi:sulfate transport system ATP-binding protein